MANWVKHFCDPCGYDINGPEELKKHLQTRKHKNKVRDAGKAVKGSEAHIEMHKAKNKEKAEALLK